MRLAWKLCVLRAVATCIRPHVPCNRIRDLADCDRQPQYLAPGCTIERRFRYFDRAREGNEGHGCLDEWREPPRLDLLVAQIYHDQARSPSATSDQLDGSVTELGEPDRFESPFNQLRA
jgi:hypothetical protein